MLQAGAARAVISPDHDRITVFGEKARGVYADIYARALSLYDGEQRLVIVTYDLNCLDVATPVLRQRCERELGLPVANLLLLATHNHNAPIQIVPDNFDYGLWLAETIFALIQEAIANEQGPARVRFGSGAYYGLKALGNCPLDPEVQVLEVSRDEKPLAIFFNHPTHPQGAEPFVVEPGHPGAACHALEGLFPGVVALYADACGGNQFAVRVEDDASQAEAVHALGSRLAEVVRSVCAGPMTDVTGPLRSSFVRVTLPLAEPLSLKEVRALAKKRKVPLDVGLVAYPDSNRGTNWIRRLIQCHEKGLPFPKTTADFVSTDDTHCVPEHTAENHNPATLEARRAYPCQYEEVIVAHIGTLVFVAMQGEVCAPIGARIKDEFRAYHPILVGAYMGEHNLYIPTRELVREDAYQAQTIQIQYGCPVGWDPEVEDVMVKAVIDLVYESLGEHVTLSLSESVLTVVRKTK